MFYGRDGSCDVKEKQDEEGGEFQMKDKRNKYSECPFQLVPPRAVVSKLVVMMSEQ